MSKLPKRARRRHDRWRMIQRALRIFRRFDHFTVSMHGFSNRCPYEAQRCADNMKRSGCNCCSYLREHEGPTMQERKLFDSHPLDEHEEAA